MLKRLFVICVVLAVALSEPVQEKKKVKIFVLSLRKVLEIVTKLLVNNRCVSRAMHYSAVNSTI